MHKYFMTVLKISKYLQGLVLKTMQAWLDGKKFLAIFNNYSSSLNGLRVNSTWARRPNGILTQRPWGQEEYYCFSKILLVGKKYQDKTTYASKMQFSCHCFGFQSQRFSLLVGYNIYPSSGSTNQNATLIIDH